MVYIVHVCHIDDWKYCFELKQYPYSSALFTTTSWTIQYIDTLHLHVHVLHVHVYLSNIRVLQSYKIIMSLLSSVLLRVNSTSNNVRTKKTTIFRIAWYHVIMMLSYSLVPCDNDMLYEPSISLKHVTCSTWYGFLRDLLHCTDMNSHKYWYRFSCSTEYRISSVSSRPQIDPVLHAQALLSKINPSWRHSRDLGWDSRTHCWQTILLDTICKIP